ncbi:MAG: pseudaminic acid synthase [Opitutales bacterium]
MICPATPTIAGRPVHAGQPPYIVAELSANHNGSLEQAKTLVAAAAATGADAVKVQTYTADSLTLPLDQPPFRIEHGPWAGQRFHQLYTQAALPLEWTGPLADCARDHELTFFSTPFDQVGVDFLERTIDPPAYKVASYEIAHRPLLERIAATGKPVILSTGMATESEIARAVGLFRDCGNPLILLKCVSAYPARVDTFNLRSLATLAEQFNVPVGLSDHTCSDAIALGAIALGACLIEKHLCLSRSDAGVDSHFSIEPNDFAQLVRKVRELHAGLGSGHLDANAADQGERRHRRSIFVNQRVQAGDTLDERNLQIVRPGNGLDPWRWDEVCGATATRDLLAGHPLKEGDWADQGAPIAVRSAPDAWASARPERPAYPLPERASPKASAQPI